MFIEMFAASALATVIFGGRGDSGSSKDYSYEFSRLHGRLDTIEGKIDTLVDNQTFMRARSCLDRFSPTLLDGVKLTCKHHSIQDIMEAAEEGFNILCKTACADEKCFPEAYKVFSETWGNAEWVNDKFGKEIDAWEEKIAKFDRDLNEWKENYPKCYVENAKIITDLVKNPPVIGRFFKEVDKEKLTEIVKKLFEIDYVLPELLNVDERSILREKYACDEIKKAIELPDVMVGKKDFTVKQWKALGNLYSVLKPGFTKEIKNLFTLEKRLIDKTGDVNYAEILACSTIRNTFRLYKYKKTISIGKNEIDMVVNALEVCLKEFELV